MPKKIVKIFVFHCTTCKEDFESKQGQHREKCPSCMGLCSVKTTYEIEE